MASTRTGAKIVLSIAGVFLGVAAVSAISPLRLVLYGVEATGSYDGSVAHTGGSHGGTFLYPQARFVTADGRSFTVTSSVGSTGQPYADGEHVGVLYPKDHPEQARLKTFWTLWLPVTFFAVPGLLLLGIGWLLW